ncbi:hypothetical protein ALI22I_02770 [Saccharothrix sp. ALI-22-I]|nr:hypothetical protein ALI22I_02770 [Saccharothrix sp. ALI-22-I]
MSTSEFQDRRTSRLWQREVAERLVAGHGVIVAEYFEAGCTRLRAWADRPQASRLLAALEDPDRGFDAIVVGEYERGFCGDQFVRMAPLFERLGVQVWLPEAGGRVDMARPAHEALVVMLGARSDLEIRRVRHRVIGAMRAQTYDQGRYLGGRPPYGYRLVDGGPHPNRAHARWGRRLQRLAPDPATAPHVRWIFTERLAGRSIAGIARELNERAVPCPSSADADRNPHRSGEAWTLITVAKILENPRYTGRQVWNRVANDREHPHPTSGRPAQRANDREDWVISANIAHTALVSEADFLLAQARRAARPTADGSVRRYHLSGLLVCGVCRRRLESHWVHGRAGYRCRHGYTSARSRPADAPRNVYLREDHLVDVIVEQLVRERHHVGVEPAQVAAYLLDNRLTVTCDAHGVGLRLVPVV